MRELNEHERGKILTLHSINRLLAIKIGHCNYNLQNAENCKDEAKKELAIEHLLGSKRAYEKLSIMIEAKIGKIYKSIEREEEFIQSIHQSTSEGNVTEVDAIVMKSNRLPFSSQLAIMEEAYAKSINRNMQREETIKQLKEWIEEVVRRESVYAVKGQGKTLTIEEIRKAKQLLNK